MHRSILPALLGGAFLTLVLACGDDATGPPPVGEVDETGGTIEASTGTGRVKLTVPPGAVSSNVTITVEAVTDPPPADGLQANSTFDFGPDGTQFSEPVDMTIGYDPANLPAGAPEAGLVIKKLVGETWQEVPGSTVDRATDDVTAPVTSFSTYGVVFLGAPQEIFTDGEVQTAEVGTAVSTAPSVQVRTEAGDPISGLQVTFSVAEGGGSITGASQVTDAEGRATVGSWTLGTVAGTNVLQAAVEGLDDPVVFEATAAAGPSAALTVVDGDGQAAPRGTAVEVSPAVRVADRFDNSLEGVTVDFTADAGGSLSSSAATTDTAGVAGVETWTMGAIGTNTLTATVDTLDPVVFTAESLDPCTSFDGIAVGDSISGEITADVDCLPEGSQQYRDRFSFAGPANVAFAWDDNQTDVFVTLGRPGEDFVRVTSFVGASSTAASVGSGEWTVQVIGNDGATGPYTVAVEAVPNEYAGCPWIWITPGGGITGRIDDDAAGDSQWFASQNCADDFAPPDVTRWIDNYVFQAVQGRSYTATATGGDLGLLFSLWSFSTGFLEAKEGPAGTPLSHSFTAESDGFFSLHPINLESAAMGSYAISLSETGSAAPRMAPGAPWSAVDPRPVTPEEMNR